MNPACSTGDCPEEQRLRQLLDPEAEVTQSSVCAHVDECVLCQQRLQALAAAEPLKRHAQDPGAAPGLAIDPVEVDGFLAKLQRNLRVPTEAAVVRDAMAAVQVAVEAASLQGAQVGPYRIERSAGRGGMSIVYQATDTRLNRTVALKMLSDRPGNPTGARRERIEREAAVLARLSHPHIVPLYEVGDHHGQMYLVLEYIAGPTLARWALGRAIPAPEAAQAVETLARAVQNAHEQGVIHRDLKPGNILLQPLADELAAPDAGTLPLAAYRLKITDFGLARWRDDQAERLTLTGQPVGTPAYMAPEQVQDQTAAIGPATDVYALGAVLYELLTGRPPLLASSPVGTLRLIEQSEPIAPRRLEPSVPRDLETITLKCLEKDPERRYPTAQALADDLERFRGHRPIQARPPGWPGRAVRWARRNRATAATGALALALLVALAVGGVTSALIQRQLRDQAESRAQQALRAEAQARQNLRATIFQLDDFASGFRRLGPTQDPGFQGLLARCFEQGVRLSQQYLAERPASTAWNLADLQVAVVLVKLQSFLGQDQAVQSLAHQTRLAADRLDQPDAGDRRQVLQVREAAYYNLAQVHKALGQPAQVRDCLEQVDRVQTLRLGLDPDSPSLLGQRFSTQGQLAQTLDQLGEPERALAVARASLAISRRLLHLYPGVAPYQRLHAQRVQEVVDRLLARGQRDEARALLLQEGEFASLAASDDPPLQALRLALLRRWVQTVADAPDDQFAPALAALQAQTRPGPRPLELELAPLVLDQGQPERARQLARQARAGTSLPPALLIELAALSGSLAQQQPPDPDRRAADLEQALTLLEQAQAAGALADPQTRQALTQQPAFAPLRPHARFQRLLDAAPAPATP